MMAVSGNPISLIEKGRSVTKVRVEWTRSGLIFAGIGAALFAVGMWRVDGVMASMGLAAGVLLAGARWIGVNNVRGLNVSYRGPIRVEAGKGFEAKVELSNVRRLFDGLWVEFGVVLMGDVEVSGRVSWIEANRSVFLVRRVSLKKRGLARTQSGWARSSFPLGLMKFHRSMVIEMETGVFPFSRMPEELRFSGFLIDGPPLGGAGQLGGIGEWRGLAEWRGGDAVKKIAWAASLKSEMSGGGLLVRQYEPPGSQAEACVVIFHSYGGDRNLIRPDRFENALSLLSGVLGALQGCGMPVRLLADFRAWEPLEIRSRRELAGLREELISVERAGWTERHDLLEALCGVAENECLVVLSDMPAGSWSGLIPPIALAPVVVDIEKYGRSPRRSFLKGKGAKR